MRSAITLQSARKPRLDRALQFVVVQAWDELMPDPTSGLIHIEYETGSDGLLDFLKVWASTVRGNWVLVCEYWLRPLWSHATGLRFGEGYHSLGFADSLERLAGHQDQFTNLPNRTGLIQVPPPSCKERSQATRWMSMAQRLTSTRMLVPAAV